MIKKLIAHFRIPKGPYCYYKGKPCPYYREFWPEDNWEFHISYCKYLDFYSPYHGRFDPAFFDQCKICGVNYD